MNYELLTALTVFAFAGSATPGPNNLMLLTSGANFGFQRTVPHITGIIIGFAIMMMLVGAGLMRLFTAFPISYLMLKFASIAYLLFLAWKIATAASFDDDANHNAKGKPFTFLQAALFQWVNPKSWSFTLAALSAYTLPAQPLYGVLIVTFVFTMVNIVTTSSWTALGVQVRRFLSNPVKLRIFNVTVAVLLIGSLYPIVFR